MNTPFLSIAMPALNEEKNILSAVNNTLNAFRDLKVDGEIVVVNDGSNDRTPDIVKELISKQVGKVRLINHDTPQGIGASFWDGVDNAKGEVICLLPADNEIDAYEILRYIRLLDDVDMVVPFVYNKHVRSRSRRLLSFLYTLIVNLTFGSSFNYTNGTVLYRRSVLKELDCRSSGFFYQTDILVRLVKGGYLFAEVPYRLTSRKGGRSKAISISSFLCIARDYLGLIKKVYFRKEERLKRYEFTNGSVSERRHKK